MSKEFFISDEVLIVVDVQNDFCPGGSLAVKDGDQVVEPINRIVKLVEERGLLVAFTRDWHPVKTRHFKKWPPHCIKGTTGAEFHSGLYIPTDSLIFSKGIDQRNAYSAFDGKTAEGLTLEEILKQRGVQRLYMGGLATDYCVKFSALGGIQRGFEVFLLKDACRAVNIKPGDELMALGEMVNAGVQVIDSRGLISGMLKLKVGS